MGIKAGSEISYSSWFGDTRAGSAKHAQQSPSVTRSGSTDAISFADCKPCFVYRHLLRTESK